HLSGLVGGVVAAWLLRSSSPAPLFGRRTPAIPGSGPGDAATADAGAARSAGARGTSGAGWPGFPAGSGGAPGTRGSGTQGAGNRGAGNRNGSGNADPARDGRTRPVPGLGSKAADDLLRQIDEMGL